MDAQRVPVSLFYPTVDRLGRDQPGGLAAGDELLERQVREDGDVELVEALRSPYLKDDVWERARRAFTAQAYPHLVLRAGRGGLHGEPFGSECGDCGTPPN